MRKIFSLLSLSVLSVTLVFTSCKKDDKKSTQDQLVGKWTMEAAIGKYTDGDQVENDTTTFTGSSYIQFNKDNTLHIEDDGETHDGTWTLSNNKIVITGTDDYLDYPGGFSITTLNASQLELFYSATQGSMSLEQKLKLKR